MYVFISREECFFRRHRYARSLHRSMAKLGFTAAFSTAPLHHGLQKVAKLVDFVEIGKGQMGSAQWGHCRFHVF